MKLPRVFLKISPLSRIQDTGTLEISDTEYCQVYFLRTEKKHYSNWNANVSVLLYLPPIFASQNTLQSSELLDNVEVRKRK